MKLFLALQIHKGTHSCPKIDYNNILNFYLKSKLEIKLIIKNDQLKSKYHQILNEFLQYLCKNDIYFRDQDEMFMYFK